MHRSEKAVGNLVVLLVRVAQVRLGLRLGLPIQNQLRLVQVRDTRSCNCIWLSLIVLDRRPPLLVQCALLLACLDTQRRLLDRVSQRHGLPSCRIRCRWQDSLRGRGCVGHGGIRRAEPPLLVLNLQGLDTVTRLKVLILLHLLHIILKII